MNGAGAVGGRPDGSLPFRGSYPGNRPSDRRRRLRLPIAIVAVAGIVAGGWTYYGLRSSPSSPPPIFELASVDVGFTGSAADDATPSEICSDCEASFQVGESWWDSFYVSLPDPSFYCSNIPHTYSVAQVAGPSSGAFVLTKATWDYGVAGTSTDPLPATLPGCVANSTVGSVEIGTWVDVVDEGPSIQTLDITVTVESLT